MVIYGFPDGWCECPRPGSSLITWGNRSGIPFEQIQKRLVVGHDKFGESPSRAPPLTLKSDKNRLRNRLLGADIEHVIESNDRLQIIISQGDEMKGLRHCTVLSIDPRVTVEDPDFLLRGVGVEVVLQEAKSSWSEQRPDEFRILTIKIVMTVEKLPRRHAGLRIKGLGVLRTILVRRATGGQAEKNNKEGSERPEKRQLHWASTVGVSRGHTEKPNAEPSAVISQDTASCSGFLNCEKPLRGRPLETHP